MKRHNKAMDGKAFMKNWVMWPPYYIAMVSKFVLSQEYDRIDYFLFEHFTNKGNLSLFVCNALPEDKSKGYLPASLCFHFQVRFHTCWALIKLTHFPFT